MALTPTTLQDLLTNVRQRTNMEVNNFVSDPELTTYLNADLSVLDDFLISKFNDYKLTDFISSVAANTNYISLPADFVKLRGVDIWYDQTTSDGYRDLNQYSFRHRNRKANGFVSTYGPADLEYRLQDQQVVLTPALYAPNYLYRIWYTPGYIPLVCNSPSNTIANIGDGYNTQSLSPYMDTQSWCEYAVVSTAIKVLEKQDLDPSIFMAQKAELKEHIIKLATPNRNSGEPNAMTNSHRNGWGGAGGCGGDGFGFF